MKFSAIYIDEDSVHFDQVKNLWRINDGQVKSPPEFEGEKVNIGSLQFQLLRFCQNF